MQNNCKVLPISIDGTKIFSKDDLRKYPLQGKITLKTLYNRYLRDNIEDPFISYYTSWCIANGFSEPPYKLAPCDFRTRDWRALVRERIGQESIEAILDNLLEMAMQNNKSAISAAQLLADWYGVPKQSEVKVDADVKADVDAKVSLKPDLFSLPEGGESNG